MMKSSINDILGNKLQTKIIFAHTISPDKHHHHLKTYLQDFISQKSPMVLVMWKIVSNYVQIQHRCSWCHNNKLNNVE